MAKMIREGSQIFVVTDGEHTAAFTKIEDAKGFVRANREIGRYGFKIHDWVFLDEFTKIAHEGYYTKQDRIDKNLGLF
jgi:hypothetical protein